MKHFGAMFVAYLSFFCITFGQAGKKAPGILERLQSEGHDPRISNIRPDKPAVVPLSIQPERDVPTGTVPRTVRLKTQQVTVAPNIRMHPNAGTTQSEMSIHTHPTNPDIVIAGSNAAGITGNFISQGWYYTTNGGTTWLGGDTLPTHTDFSTFLSDPAVGIDLDNRLYFNAINVGFPTTDMFVARSTDDGSSWSQAFVNNPGGGEDKGHFTVDVNPGSQYENYLYTAFTDFGFTPAPIVLSRSTDHGQNFSAPVEISGDIGGLFAQGINLATGPDSELYAVWSGYDAFPTTSTTLGFNVSKNGGTTWGAARAVDTIHEIRGSLTKGGNDIRVSSFPSMAVDRSNGPRRGWIYVVYPEKVALTPDIMMIRSTNGGTSWSDAKKVNQDDGLNDQWYPWVTVDPTTGGLYIVYYDSRNFPANDSAQVYISNSLDGGDTFEDVLVSDRAFLPEAIDGLASGYMGDYIGIAALNGIVWPCWNDNRTGRHQAYTSRIQFISVGSSATINVSPDSLDFGTFFVGYSDTLSLSIRNLGYPDTLFISEIRSDSALFTPGLGSMTIPGGNSRSMSVIFSPASTGLFTGNLLFTSNDSIHPVLSVPMRGNVVYPPVIGVTPDSLGFSLLEGDSASANLNVTNTGLGPLSFRVHISGSLPTMSHQTPLSSAPSPSSMLDDEKHNGTDEAQARNRNKTSLSTQAQHFYSGTQMQIGISDFGEIMPFQSPLGIEHLQVGAYLSGYTLAYVDGGIDKVAYAVFDNQNGFMKVSYNEIENSSTRTVVEVVVRTIDGTMELLRRIIFDKSGKSVGITTSIRNISATQVTNVVLKEEADWDVDGDFDGDNWDYDASHNMIYAYKNHYVSIAGLYNPDFATADGWINFGGRQTTDDRNPHFSFDGMELLHYEMGDVPAGGGLELQVAYAAGNSLAELQRSVEAGFAQLGGWISVAPDSGAVAPGGNTAVQVKITTGNLDGGTYHASIQFENNDPGHNPFSIPVELRVTGKPDIAVAKDTIDFGNVFIGSSDTMALRIDNKGSDTLHVSNIVSSEPLFTLLDTTTFAIVAHGYKFVRLRFSPDAPAPESGVVTISSDDPQDPNWGVNLVGAGIYPPVIAITPDSVGVIMNEGDSLVTPLKIANHGLGELHWTAKVAATRTPSMQAFTLPAQSIQPNSTEAGGGKTPSNMQRLKSVTADLADLTGKRIGFTNSSFYTAIWTDITARGARVSYISFPLTAGVLDTLDVLSVDDALAFVSSTDIALIRTWLESGKALIMQGDDQESMININALLSGTGISETFLGGYYDANFTNILIHPTTADVNSITAVSYGSYATVTLPAQTIVYDTLARPSIAVSTLGNGRILVSGNEVMGNSSIGGGDTRLFSNQIIDWLAGQGDFVTISPISGIVAPADSQSLNVKIKTDRLYGGTYHAYVQVANDDPGHNLVTVPVEYRVIGKPDIALSEDSLNFGDIFINNADTLTLLVINDGSDTLHVSGMSLGNPMFTVIGPTAFNLSQHTAHPVRVRFYPTAAVPESGALTIFNDDPQDSVLNVQLIGNGTYPPVIGVTPDSLGFTLLEGDSAFANLNVTNTGLGPLTFHININGSLPAMARQKPDSKESPQGTNLYSSPNSTDQTKQSSGTRTQHFYTGTHMRIGISDFGEIMPFESPLGYEHLQIGGYFSGYTLAYVNAGVDNVAYSVFQSHGGFTQVSYNEIEDSPARTVVEAVVRTNDNKMELLRHIVFDKSHKSVAVTVTVRNISATPSTNVVLKEEADWDVDDDYDDDDWSYDSTHNMIYAFENHYVAIAGLYEPDFASVAGGGAYASRATTNDRNPRTHFDGLELLHYEMGDVAAGGKLELQLAYAAGNSLADLQASVEQGLALSGGWISVAPDTGLVAPGGNANVQVKIKTDKLDGGTYHASIHFANNDPGHNPFTVPVELRVIGKPEIVLSKDSLNFGDVFINYSDTLTFIVSNNGSDTLHVTGMTPGNPKFTVVGPSAFDLPQHEVYPVTVMFSPTTVGPESGVLTIANDDPQDSLRVVQLFGNSVYPPAGSVTPDSLAFTVLSGNSANATLTLSNTGLGPLNFFIKNEVAAGSGANQPGSGSGRSTVLSVLKMNSLAPAPSGSAPVAPNLTATAEQGKMSLESVIQSRKKFGTTGMPIKAAVLDSYGADHAGRTWDSLNANWGRYGSIDIIVDYVSLNKEDITYADLANTGADVVIISHAWTSSFGWEFSNDEWAAITQYVDEGHGLIATAGSLNSTVAENNRHNLSRLLGLDTLSQYRWPSSAGTALNFATPGHYLLSNISPPYQPGNSGSAYPHPVHNWTRVAKSSKLIAISSDSLAAILTSRNRVYISNIPEYSPNAEDFQLLYNAIVWTGGSTSWLRETPLSGTVPPGGSIPIGITVTPDQDENGTYRANIQIASNDPVHPELTVQVALSVYGLNPVVRVTPESLATSIFYGDSASYSLMVYNDGDGPLHVTAREHTSEGSVVGNLSNGSPSHYLMRGNIYRVYNTSTLEEFKTYCEIPGPTHMQFAVYASDILTGSYHRLKSTTVYLPAGSAEFYSSGPMNVTLRKGLYYFFGAASEDNAKYFLTTPSLPLHFWWGDAVSSGRWIYDEGSTDISPPIFETIWRQSVVISGTVARSIVPDTMTIPAGGNREVILGTGNKMPFGKFDAQLVLESNDKAKPEVRVPLHLDVSLRLNAASGWNIFSVPVTAEDNRKEVLFPAAGSAAFNFTGHYNQVESLKFGEGYWLKYETAQVISFGGKGMGENTVRLRNAWNLIGPPSYLVTWPNVQSDPSGNLLSHFVAWSPAWGYYETDSLLPGMGAWVKAAGDGDLFFNEEPGPASGAVLSTAQISPAHKSASENAYNTLSFTDAAGKVRTLYFSGSIPGGKNGWMEVPPPAPRSEFDVRFASQRLVEEKDSAQTEFPIKISGAAYPLKIQWTIRGEEAGHTLAIAYRDGRSELLSMKKSGSVVITEQNLLSMKLVIGGESAANLPKSFAMYQNYPNPFNPSTRFRFDLPVDSRVRLYIYNTLGQEVARLVDGVDYAAGTQTVIWNGAGRDAQALPSGVYFYRINAAPSGGQFEPFAKTGKMLLMK